MRCTGTPSWLAVAALTAFAAACGGHPATVPAGAAPGPSAAAAPTSSSLAAALNAGGFACTAYAPNPDLQLGREGGTCSHAVKKIALTTYATPDQQATAKKIIDASGLASGWSVSGDRWFVSGIGDRAGADLAARILGGAVDNP